jgi:hypothetical protein
MAVNLNFLTKLREAVLEMFIIQLQNSVIINQLVIILLQVTLLFH